MVNYLISEALSSYPNYVILRTVLLSKSLLQSPKTNKKNTTNKKEQAIATGSKLFSKLKTVIFRKKKTYTCHKRYVNHFPMFYLPY